MNNPLQILWELDKYLTEETPLIIFGKAAIVLGYPTAPEDYESTQDVDAIIPMEILEALCENEGFWNALNQTNEALKDTGLYMTHIFQEDQIILSTDWLQNTVPIETGFKHLKIQRPSTIDLVLTKMARGDDADMEEIKFLIKTDKITPDQLKAAFQSARVPNIPEIKEIFVATQNRVRQLFENRTRGEEKKDPGKMPDI